jgi:hypothetical protein
MVYFVYLKEKESGCDDIPKTGQAVKAGSNDTIIVSFDCLPISIGFSKKLFPDVLIDAKDYDCVIISIYDLYDKLRNTEIDSNIELAESIRSYYDIKGWAWNIDMPNFKHFPEPSGHTHCWVRHIQSWKPTCKDCFKPNCPSVKILSDKIYQPRLQKIYCDCQKCDECGCIYDNDECKCQLSRQKSSDASSDSRFVRCEHCGRPYDSFDETSIYTHDRRCC